MDTPEVRYPIYLRDLYGWMVSAHGDEDLQRRVEPNDADGEYSGWDHSGRPLRIVWRDKRVAIADLGQVPEPGALIEGLHEHARLWGIYDELQAVLGPKIASATPEELWGTIEMLKPDPRPWVIKLLMRLMGVRGDPN